MTTQFQIPPDASNVLSPAYVTPRIRRRPFGLRAGRDGPGGIRRGSRATRVDGSRNGDVKSLLYNTLIGSGILAGSSLGGSGRWGGGLCSKIAAVSESSESINHGFGAEGEVKCRLSV